MTPEQLGRVLEEQYQLNGSLMGLSSRDRWTRIATAAITSLAQEAEREARTMPVDKASGILKAQSAATAAAWLGKESQQAAPERSQDSGQALIDTDLAKFVVMHEKAEKEKAQAELTRLTALLEDREALAKVIQEAFGTRSGTIVNRQNRQIDVQIGLETSLKLADRIREYLTASTSLERENEP